MPSAATTRGVPYPAGTDPAANINEDMQALAQWINDNPGKAVVTTVQRDALAVWTGRTVYNTTTARSEVWNGAQWVADHPNAAGVSYAGAANLVAANVEAALDELDAEKAGLALANIFTAAQEVREAVAARPAAAGSDALRVSVLGDAQNRLNVRASGKMEWGPGGAAGQDVSLERNRAEVLRSDGSIEADEVAVITGGRFLFGHAQGNRYLRMGTGSPEGVQTANVGSAYLRDDGGAGTTLYVKQSGIGNTGWVGK